MFSSSPRNVFSINYTEVNLDVIDKLFKDGNPDKDIAYEILFRINQITRESAQKLEEELKDDEALVSVFQRFWKDNKPNYRVFLTILAACGCVKNDIYSKSGRPTYIETIELLVQVQDIIDKNPDIFLRYYELAFTSVALEAIKENLNRDETLQRMKTTIEQSNFGNLYLKLRAMASTDYWLKQFAKKD